MAFLLYSHYTTGLIAIQTAKPKPNPVRSFQDVIDRNYHVYVERYTASEEFLKTGTDNLVTRYYYNDRNILFAIALPDSAMSAVYSQVASDPKSFRKFADAKEVLLNDQKALYFYTSMAVFDDSRFKLLNIVDAIKAEASFSVKKNSGTRDTNASSTLELSVQ